ncbi:hypothetical protein V8F33_003684 [Rhypophila sp. PSN 637]
MNLLNLSGDVMRLILHHLRQSDLPTLCLTHPDLRQLARPVLYSSVQLPSGFLKNQPHPLPSFLRTILSQPELSRRIRRLSFVNRHRLEGFWYVTVPKFQVSPSDMEAVVQFVKNCQVPYRDFWIEALQAGTVDAWLAVLLLNLPSIDYLRIDQGLLRESEFVGRVLRSYLCDTPPSLDPSPIRNTPNMLLVFYFPSVERVSFWIDDPADEFRWPTSNPPQALGLKSLKVQGLSEAQLGKLLSATPSLHSLKYTREFFLVSTLHPLVLQPIINLQTLGISLAVVKDTLTKLQIKARDHSISRGVHGNTRLRFEGPTRFLCLAEFHQLKVLEVPSEFIMGCPAMPVLEDNLPLTSKS